MVGLRVSRGRASIHRIKYRRKSVDMLVCCMIMVHRASRCLPFPVYWRTVYMRPDICKQVKYMMGIWAIYRIVWTNSLWGVWKKNILKNTI